MTMAGSLPLRVRLAGEGFTFLKHRFLGGGTYRNATGGRYLRIGPTAQIDAEVRAVRDRLRAGFAVPSVTARGALDSDRAFFVEDSIGETTFGDLFEAQTARDGRVADGTFDAYLDVMARYLATQCATAALGVDVAGDLATLVLRSAALRDDPAGDIVLAAYDQARATVTGSMWCPSQGDLNPYNTLPGGVIDFELAAAGPLGYDVLTAVHFGRLWPGRYEAYAIGTEQIRQYEDRVDDVLAHHGQPAATELRDTLLFLKVFWATARDAYHASNPDVDAALWRWRSALRTRCAERYLRGDPIRTDGFADLSLDEGNRR